MDFVNRVSLEYMTRCKTGSGSMSTRPQLETKDVRFYRKRIIGKLRDLLYKDDAVFTPTTIQFLNETIDAFKTMDHVDLLQAEFFGMGESTTTDITDYKATDYIMPDKLLMRSKRVNLDKFAIRSGKRIPIMPQAKEVNLEDPALRTKGLTSEKMADIGNSPKTDALPTKENIPIIHEVKKKTNKKKKTKLYVEI